MAKHLPDVSDCPICGGKPYCEQVDPWNVKENGVAPWAMGCYRQVPFEHFVGVNGDTRAETMNNWNAETAKVAALKREAAPRAE